MVVVVVVVVVMVVRVVRVVMGGGYHLEFGVGSLLLSAYSDVTRFFRVVLSQLFNHSSNIPPPFFLALELIIQTPLLVALHWRMDPITSLMRM